MSDVVSSFSLLGEDWTLSNVARLDSKSNSSLDGIPLLLLRERKGVNRVWQCLEPQTAGDGSIKYYQYIRTCITFTTTHILIE